MKYIIDIPNEMVIKSPLKGLTLGIAMIETSTQKQFIVPTNIPLMPYTEPDRKDIEDEVWELARRIICPSDCCEDSISAHTKEIFNKEGWEIRGIFNDLSYQETKSKYEAWLKQKDEIHVGDEVIPIDVNYDTMIVTRIWMDDHSRDCLDTLGLDGSICSFLTSNVKKTGRHFPEVAKMLKKMRGEEQ